MMVKTGFMKYVFSFGVLITAILVMACSGSNANDNQEDKQEMKQSHKQELSAATSADTETQPQNTVAKDKYPLGYKVYNEHCITCHMENGKGVEGVYPPLANSDYLMADKERAVIQVINGSDEKMVVNGVTYNNPMPPQDVNKEEAVAVVNFILNSWGNDGGTISIDEVDFTRTE